MISYFEIGGQIVECQQHSTSIPSSLFSPSLFRGAPTHSRSAGASATESNNSGGRKGDHFLSMDRSTPGTRTVGEPIVPYPFGIFHLEKFLPE
jgi:hypothetical protein